MNALATHTRTTAVATGFRWRDRQGQFHEPRDMETRHLFHTVSMIWNHVMPDDAATHEFRRYQFSPFYTASYMQRAVRALLAELLTRTDLTGAQRQRLSWMRAYITAQSVEEPNVLGMLQ
jgi:hypothetical protein